MHKRTTISIKR